MKLDIFVQRQMWLAVCFEIAHLLLCIYCGFQKSFTDSYSNWHARQDGVGHSRERMCQNDKLTCWSLGWLRNNSYGFHYLVKILINMRIQQDHEEAVLAWKRFTFIFDLGSAIMCIYFWILLCRLVWGSAKQGHFSLLLFVPWEQI
jgi:hypothetical protein